MKELTSSWVYHTHHSGNTEWLQSQIHPTLLLITQKVVIQRPLLDYWNWNAAEKQLALSPHQDPRLWPHVHTQSIYVTDTWLVNQRKVDSIQRIDRKGLSKWQLTIYLLICFFTKPEWDIAINNWNANLNIFELLNLQKSDTWKYHLKKQRTIVG